MSKSAKKIVSMTLEVAQKSPPCEKLPKVNFESSSGLAEPWLSSIENLFTLQDDKQDELYYTALLHQPQPQSSVSSRMPPHNDGTGESHIVLLGEDPTLCELREAGREPSKKKRLPEDGFDTDEECSKILYSRTLQATAGEGRSTRQEQTTQLVDDPTASDCPRNSISDPKQREHVSRTSLPRHQRKSSKALQGGIVLRDDATHRLEEVEDGEEAVEVAAEVEDTPYASDPKRSGGKVMGNRILRGDSRGEDTSQCAPPGGKKKGESQTSTTKKTSNAVNARKGSNKNPRKAAIVIASGAAAAAIRIPAIATSIIAHLLTDHDLTPRSRKTAEVILLATYEPIYFRSKAEIDEYYATNKMTLKRKDHHKKRMILCTAQVRRNAHGEFEHSNAPCYETATPERNGTYCRHVWTIHLGLKRADKVAADGETAGEGSGKMERKVKAKAVKGKGNK